MTGEQAVEQNQKSEEMLPSLISALSVEPRYRESRRFKQPSLSSSRRPSAFAVRPRFVREPLHSGRASSPSCYGLQRGVGTRLRARRELPGAWKSRNQWTREAQKDSCRIVYCLGPNDLKTNERLCRTVARRPEPWGLFRDSCRHLVIDASGPVRSLGPLSIWCPIRCPFDFEFRTSECESVREDKRY